MFKSTTSSPLPPPPPPAPHMSLRTVSSCGGVNVSIPPSLRTVQPFLDDALKFLRLARKAGSASNAIRCKRVALLCINNAFKLNALINTDIEAEDVSCLEEFNSFRQELVHELMASSELRSMLGNNLDNLLVLPAYTISNSDGEQNEEFGTHELLIAEADTVLAMADEQYELGFRFEAMLNYHTSCVFYRVMETMIPSKASSIQHSRLMHAANRTRLTCSLYQNFVRENFTGGSCSEVYEVHGSSKLGKGSYGSVYLATHRVTGDERAVKVMNVDRITSYYLRKLHTEISILKSLDHPNIIKIQDVFFGKRSVYIVTDLCRGGELFELLNSGKNQGFVFREDRAAKLMRDMLSAVNYLHEHGIVHRDLKLENFLFEDHNSNSPLILIDFGLSKHFSPNERLTQKVGSCYYTAPEVLNGNYDHRCDVWSLGVLCYMLLSGSPPFFGKSVEDVYHSILNKEANFNDKKFKHISNSCMDFMKRLLVREVRYRPTSAEALRHPFISGASFFPKYDNIRPGEIAEHASGALSLLSINKINQIMDSFMIYVRADNLTRALMKMVAHSFGSTELNQFREEFQAIDRTGTGSISMSDFLISFAASDTPSMRGMDLKTIFNAISFERQCGHGKNMTYHEYMTAAMHNRVDVEDNRIHLIFSYMAAEHREQLTPSNIRQFLGDDHSVAEYDAMVAVVGGSSKHVSKTDVMKQWKKMW
eukprot:CAMPEP_0170076906 /NCGR_PEP_ID=MMETSP0019_2-20121128/13831_1 /TAXON_ID=98059 /ORGANISM="Dinobryon sp., Strain UTEXLB2267" /LENGTH=706 /DNA_ID=CAMNT_0010288919 /DNA_START=132 /DNA_END=2249 /DNA_ORIENTATION=+